MTEGNSSDLQPGWTERRAISAIKQRCEEAFGQGAAGEVWIGDDAAVLVGSGPTVVSVDVVVDGVHADRRLTTTADLGWRALAAAVSDLAAMGASPTGAVLGVVASISEDLDALYQGLVASGLEHGCPIVGGDLVAGDQLTISVTVLGRPGPAGPILRSGAQPGDVLFVTGPLGGAAAGLRFLRAGYGRHPADLEVAAAVERHARPRARLSEGMAAASLGVHAMVDVSDGLSIDLDRMAEASGVGIALETVPCALRATEDEALGGGDDYELLLATPDPLGLLEGFAAAGFTTPTQIGEVSDVVGQRTLRGGALPLRGFTYG